MDTRLEKNLSNKISLQNKRILNRIVKQELDKIFRTDYYGTLEQIDNEMLIMENAFVKDNCEMEYNESIEEWYLRIYDMTKEE